MVAPEYLAHCDANLCFGPVRMSRPLTGGGEFPRLPPQAVQQRHFLARRHGAQPPPVPGEIGANGSARFPRANHGASRFAIELPTALTASGGADTGEILPH